MNEMAAAPERESPRKPGAATLFAILDVADQIEERIGQALAGVGLSYPKYEVLQSLHEAREPLTLGCLAEGQSCARSNITQLIDRLEADGLVRRVADPVDRRSVRAELTEAGVERVGAGKAELDRVLAEFEASFDASERSELRRLLAKLT